MRVDIIKNYKKTLLKVISSIVLIIIIYCGYQYMNDGQGIRITAETILKSRDILINISILIIIVGIYWYFSKELRENRVYSEIADNIIKNQKDENTKIKEGNIYLERLNELSRTSEFGKLSRGLFHDLLSPLTSLNLYIQKLNTYKYSNKEEKEVITKAIEAGEKMAFEMENIKKAIREERFERVMDLKEEIKDAVCMLSYKLRMLNVKVEQVLEENCIIFTNPIKFKQVMLNIISNAIDALKNNSEEKNIKIILIKSEQSFLIEIKDNGSGILKENFEKIFNPLFTTKEKDGGNGLGLSISKSIIEKDMQGKISVESVYGKGTVFRISLPP